MEPDTDPHDTVLTHTEQMYLHLLIRAMMNGWNYVTSTMLCQLPCDTRYNGYTLIMIATKFGRSEVVTALITAGAGVNEVNRQGDTALIMASALGNTPITTCVLEAGADIEKTNTGGSTPMIVASDNGSCEVVDVLIRDGANIDRANDKGSTAIYVACQRGFTTIVVALITAGARTRHPMYKTYTPLMVASIMGHLEVVRALTGFIPNTKGWYTFLAGACSDGGFAALQTRRSPRRPKSYLPMIFNREYLELIWEFARERYSDLHMKGGRSNHTAQAMAVERKRGVIVRHFGTMC